VKNRLACSVVWFGIAFLSSSVGAVDVLTFHNDTHRSGANTSETILNQSNVNATNFGKLYTRSVDGLMYAQPLYVSNLTIGGGTHNVVFIATMKNNVYAFDADNGAQAAYWTKNLGTSVPYSDVYTNGDHNMFPDIGICGTPVIDKSTNTMYLCNMTKDGTNAWSHHVHALDITTGNDKFGGPIKVTAPAVPNSTAVFNDFRQGQRPAMLQANGSIYIGFASFGDQTPYWGWLMRYDQTTLAQQFVFNTNPSNTNSTGAGIWQSGCGPALDASNNVFLVTGNSSQGAGSTGPANGNYSEAVLKFGPTGLTVADYYLPSDVNNIDASDGDFGGGGHALLPDMPGIHPHVMVAAGKNGVLYLLDRDNLTHFAADNDARILQKITSLGSNKSTPVYWQSPTGPHVIVQNESSGPMYSYSVVVNNSGIVQLTNKASTGTVVTMTTAVPHGFVAGNTVAVACNPSDPNIDMANAVVVSAPTTTTFTYNKTATAVTSTATGGTATKGYVQLALDKQTANGFQTQSYALSSNGSVAGSGIVWTWSGTGGDLVHQGDPNVNGGNIFPATLRAINAETMVEIYNSGTNFARDALGGFCKYNCATVANGRVYVPETGNPSSTSQLVVYGLLGDVTPPTISSVSAVNTTTKVAVKFSKPVDATTATAVSNYGINNGVAISGASLGSDQITVTLTTSTLTSGTTYTLTVNNIKDLASPPNTILANSQAQFQITTQPPSVSITSPTSGATFSSPAVFQVTANATAGVNLTISKVDFYLGAVFMGTATVAPYTVTLTNVAAGSYNLTAKATDSSTLSTTSTAIPITVNTGSGTPYGQNALTAVSAYLNGALPSTGAGNFPPLLSQLGAFSNLTTLTPSNTLVPYSPISPLWSDSAIKTRWMAVPNNGSGTYTADQQISFAPTGDWTFPNGTVFVKEFDLGIDDTNPSITRRLETRFIVRSSDGYVYGITYKWRSDNSDADLVSASGLDEVITIATGPGTTRQQTWHYPSQSECLTCHTSASGGVLGPKTRQLNSTLAYPASGVTDNQLRALNHLGLLNPVLQESAIPTYSKLYNVNDTTTTLDNRVRSYIDSNCQGCHRPGGANVQLDARWDTPLQNQHIINAPVNDNLGITGAKVVVPQNVSLSILYQRVSALDTTKMPPLAHNTLDSNALAAIVAWINGLPITSGADAISAQFKDATANNVVSATAGAVARSGWNSLSGATGTNQVLNDNSGTATTATVTWSAPNTGSNGGTSTGGNDSLLRGYLDTTATGVISATVTNIPYSIYNVYVYALGDGGERVGEYWAKSTVSAGGTDTGGKIIHYSGISTQALQDATATGTGNYVVFTGLTGSTCVISGQAFQYPTAGSNGFRGNLNGFQIVDATQQTPTLNAAYASTGSTAGGQLITVTGTNLLPGADFSIGGAAAINPQYLSDKAYSMITPPGTGTAVIEYSGFNGTIDLTGGFTYSASPAVVGDAISYNYNHNDVNGGVQPLGAAETPGVVPRANWNNSTSNVNLATDLSMLDNLGNNTGASIGWSCNEHYTDSEVPDNGGNYRMMRGYIDQTNAFPIIITANNLPSYFQQCDVYVYTTGQHGTLTRHGNLRIGAKTVGANLGTGVSYPYAGSGANGFLQVPDNNADTTKTGDYVVFPNVSPVNGSLRLEIQAQDSDYRLGIAGIQLVAVGPTLTAASPANEQVAGGDTITLTGTNFRPGALSITFGGIAATNLVYVDNSHYTVSAPPHAQGVVDVVMTDTNGRIATLSGQFTYSPNQPPTVTSVSPNLVPTGGGTAVTITGTSFRTGASVQVGGQNGMSIVTIPAASVNFVSSTQLTCTIPAAVPAGATGLTTLTVIDTDATTGSLTSAFRYTNPFPILATILPTSGSSSGNFATSKATITASNHTFTPSGVQVVIGGTTVAATTVDDQHITFVPPAHSAGAVTVSVINGDGPASANALINGYTYNAPTLSSLSPNQGPTSGGNQITVFGSNFGPATVLMIAGNAATNVNVLSSSALTCLVPASTGAALGSVNAIVSDNQATPGTYTLVNGYTYIARSPEFPDTTGKIPGICAKFFYNSSADGTITPATLGPATFDSYLPFQGKMVAANAMVGPPSGAAPGTILNLVPAGSTLFTGKITGYLKISAGGLYTIYTGSDDASLFYFGNTLATSSLIVNNNTAKTGVVETNGQINLSAGLHQFTILYGQGTATYGLSASMSGPDTGNVKSIISANSLFSDPAPAITSASPNTGSTGGNTAVTLTGTGFVAGANVTVNGEQALNINVASATSITFNTPGGAAGAVKIVVINPNGNADSTAFTYDSSIFRNPDAPSNTVAGTFFRYYNLNGPALPAFGTQRPFRVGAKPSAGVTENSVTYPISQNDNQCQQITGYINIPYSGVWTLYTASDDASVLYIGTSLVVNNNYTQTMFTRSGTIGLNAGLHKFTLQYSQGTNTFGAYLGWGSATAPATIPLDTLGATHTGPPSVANQVPASSLYYVPPTWTGAGTANWSAAANWNTDVGLGAFAPVQSDSTLDAHESLVLRFPAVGAAPYVAVNDSANPTPVMVMEFNSSVAGNTISGNALQLGSGTALQAYPSLLGSFSGATMLQLGSGSVLVSAPVVAGSNLALRGNGAGVVTINGALTNANGASLTKSDGGSYVIAGDASGFTGSVTLNGGLLCVNSTLNAPTITTASGTTLRGTGTVNSAVTIKGMLYPGDVSSILTSDPKGTLTASSADFSINGGTLRARVKLLDATHAEADLLTLTSTSASGLTLDATSQLDLRVQVPAGVTVANNADVEIVQGGDPLNNLYSAGFGTVSLSYGASVTNMSILYVSKDFVPNSGDTIHVVSTQIAGGAPAPAIGANSYNRIFVRFNNSVTPVTVDAFRAAPDGAGVLLVWHTASEFQNVGFNVWRRSVQSNEQWTHVNTALIPGRITNHDAKTYRWYDWNAAESAEYRLESVDVHGVRSYYPQLVNAGFDRNSPLISASADGVATAIDSLSERKSSERGARLAQKLAGVMDPRANDPKQFESHAQGNTPPTPIPDSVRSSLALVAKITRVDRNTDPALLETLGFGGPAGIRRSDTPPLLANGIDAQVLPRWFSLSSGAVNPRGYTAAKVVYTGSGVLRVPQSALPVGFDIRRVSIQREGRAVTALAVTTDALILYAPGYNDDYTDKDAFFLTASSAPTLAGSQTTATGLFGGASSVLNTVSATATAEYHDVYFDWSLRPYTYPPWFSAQYLTDGSTQRFALATPEATGGEASLTLNVSSLTGGHTVSPDHTIQAFVNGVAAGSAAWDGGGTALALNFTIPAHVLIAGENTIDLVTPPLAGVDSQIVLLRSMSIAYTKTLTASAANDFVAHNLLASVYEAAGLTSPNVWVVDARFPDRAQLVPIQTQQQSDGSYKLHFAAQSGGTGQYLIVPAGGEMAALSVSKRTVRAITSRANYLAVGPQQFSAALQPLLALHTKEGLKSLFVDQEQLFDYYNYGRYGPDAIRNAVRALRPQYLLLVGRTTYDYHNYSGANVDPLCPSYLVPTSFWAQATSDALFADLGRGYPEIGVGRFPVNTPDELTGAVQHTLNYKGLQESGWRGHLAADAADPNAGDFPVEADGLAGQLSDVTWSKSYLGVPAGNDQPAASAALQNAANGAADLIVYIGHGNAARLGNSSPRILDTDSVQNWTGDVVFLQGTCTANWVAKDEAGYRSIAIQALTQPQGGIAASLATTTYCTSEPAVDFMQNLLKSAMDRPARWSDALLKAQQYAYQQSQVLPAQTAQWYADLARTECMLGDPALKILAAPTANGTTAPNAGVTPGTAPAPVPKAGQF